MRPLLVTIDGPAGAGKTTVSRSLADKLGYRYIDTGALYRGIAFAVQSKGVSPEDDTALEALCNSLTLKFVQNDQGLRLMLNQTDITDQIRTREITLLASAVSARPVVRKFLLGLQREMGQEKKAVFEGRDMGTVVFPQADIKFFLVASLEVRALRRYRELNGTTSQCLETVEDDIKRRDKNDSTRNLAPLKAAEDAIIIDSTELSVKEVVDRMRSCIEKIR